MRKRKQSLQDEHSPEEIRKRIEEHQTHGDLGDVVLGAVDGTVTTFAIVSGVVGAELQKGALVAFALGLANVLADGFSMAASNYLKARSDMQTIENYRRKEEQHIEEVPELELEELRQIFALKGFSGEALEAVVGQISSDKELWVNTMLTEEWGLSLSAVNPMRSAVLTFMAFLVAGMVPLIPLLLALEPGYDTGSIFALSSVAAAVTFAITGAIRGWVLNLSRIKSALETLMVGGGAAVMAYLVGHVLGDLLL